ncbi:MAG: cellulase family glycosylhydrolase [Acidobacteria bacterium]|nr:cellulase family glycosylhydrolase [Acidobacteriota bacterium]
MGHCLLIISLLIGLSFSAAFAQPASFVSVKDHQLILNDKPYYFVGTNYWYGSLIGLEKDRRRGIERLRKELDFLKKNGITNLRLLGAAEGKGPLNGIERVGPPLQKDLLEFDESVLDGLDVVLAEMAKRRMKAVIFLSNNWEWSGGFQQYLIWHRVIPEKWLTEKPTWDELRDNVAKFYSCEPCMDAYTRQAALLIQRTNKITKKPYVDDPTIMTWELANEPRPMRPSSNNNYRAWIEDTAEMIKRLDPNHLVAIGHEGRIGTESLDLFEQIHADPNIDYLTIHIWPRNWGWLEKGKMADTFSKAMDQTTAYIEEHTAVAKKLNKPLVIEEFGLTRDNESFDISAPTTLRDQYYKKVLAYVRTNPHVAGANFWAFAGTARPIKGRLFWKKGDQYTGDPPMEEQGLYSVFDSDVTTWKLLRSLKKIELAK